MSIGVGKRYTAPSGAEVIVTRGSGGVLSDGERTMPLKEEAPADATSAPNTAAPLLAVGRRFRSADGEVEVLVLRPGHCDLRYNGEAMEVIEPKILPSAD
jgi:hypothetical protein